MIHGSTTKTPRERRHDENLRRITAAAMRMVEEGGLGALSVNKLAEAVDYTPGALYRYFGSKDALLAALVGDVLAHVRGDVDRAVAALGPKATPLARVLAVVQAYRGFARREPHRFGLVTMTMADPNVLLRELDTAGPVAIAAAEALRPLHDALVDAARVGQLIAGDATERTICVFSLLQGALLLHKQARLAPELLDVGRLVLHGTRTLLLGWGADSKTVDRAIGRADAMGGTT